MDTPANQVHAIFQTVRALLWALVLLFLINYMRLGRWDLRTDHGGLNGGSNPLGLIVVDFGGSYDGSWWLVMVSNDRYVFVTHEILPDYPPSNRAFFFDSELLTKSGVHPERTFVSVSPGKPAIWVWLMWFVRHQPTSRDTCCSSRKPCMIRIYDWFVLGYKHCIIASYSLWMPHWVWVKSW